MQSACLGERVVRGIDNPFPRIATVCFTLTYRTASYVKGVVEGILQQNEIRHQQGIEVSPVIAIQGAMDDFKYSFIIPRHQMEQTSISDFITQNVPMILAYSHDLVSP
jgi:hypothetical protein